MLPQAWSQNAEFAAFYTQVPEAIGAFALHFARCEQSAWGSLSKMPPLERQRSPSHSLDTMWRSLWLLAALHTP